MAKVEVSIPVKGIDYIDGAKAISRQFGKIKNSAPILEGDIAATFDVEVISASDAEQLVDRINSEYIDFDITARIRSAV